MLAGFLGGKRNWDMGAPQKPCLARLRLSQAEDVKGWRSERDSKDLGDTTEYFIYFITLFTAHIKRHAVK